MDLIAGALILAGLVAAAVWATWDTWRQADVLDEVWLSESDERREWRVIP